MELVDANTEVSDLKSSRALSKKLSETQMFRDYEAAFSEASGSPMAAGYAQRVQRSVVFRVELSLRSRATTRPVSGNYNRGTLSD